MDYDRDNDPFFQPTKAEFRDPVCGTRIDPRHSAGTRTLLGKSVFFCSNLCLEKFDISPEHYANTKLVGKER